MARRACPWEGALHDTITFHNVWVASVDGARRRTPGSVALLIAIVVLAAALVGGGALYRAIPGPGGSGSYLGLLLDRGLQNLCIISPLYVAALLMTRGWEARAGRQASMRAPVAVGAGAAAGIGFFLLALGLAAVLGAVGPGASASAPAHRLAGLAAGAAIILFQAAGEEVFFRGWLQPVLAARWGPWIGLVTTSALFAAAHAALQPLSAVALVNDFLAGLAFGLLALRTGGLAAAIAAHWGWNWTEQSLVGATPNPGVDPLGSLFDLDLKGPGILSGGTDEMNGSICATVALAGLIAVALLLRSKARAAA